MNLEKPPGGKGLGAIGKRPFAVWIGILIPLKSPLDVIHIAARIPEMDFVMLGWPYDKSIADRLMAEKPHNVYYLGSVSDALKKELIQKCSAGLTTSRYEGFGWTPFEFLTAGKPVLGYPLKVFKEIYGDLMIYADDVAGLITCLRELHGNKFKADINGVAIRDLKTRYDFSRAARKMVRTFRPESVFIFTPDVPIESDNITGFHLVNWRLWKSIKDEGIDLHILSSGWKFSRTHELAHWTSFVTGPLISFRMRLDTLEQTTTSLARLKKKLLNLTLLLLEPLCYVYFYIRQRKKAVSSVFVIATGTSQIFAAIVLKFLLRLKVACLIHDARFCTHITEWESFLMRCYYLFFTYCLRYVDHIMVVSKAVLEECLPLYPHHDRLMVIWDESTI